MKKILFIFGVALGLLIGSFGIARAATLLFPSGGGTGVGTLPTSQLLYGAGTNPVKTVATTTASCSGSASCTSFTIIGSTPITISASGGSGSGTVGTSTNETQGFLPYWTSSSATPALLGKVATSSIGAGTGLTFSGTAGAQVGGTSGTYSVNTSQNITTLSNLTVAGTVNTTASGVLYSTATSTPSIGTVLTYSGTLGQFIGGVSGSFSIANGAITNAMLASTYTTAVSIASSNGFAGSSSGGATPALTLTTTITGLLKGNGTAISAAALTDFPAIAANTVLANLTGASAAPTAVATSSLYTLGAGLTYGTGVLAQVEHPSFQYSTSTAWTGTTTIFIQIGYAEVFNNVRCSTDAGTLGVDFYHASSHLNYIPTASTTSNTFAFSTNNTITDGDLVKVDIGTPASSPTKIICTVKDTI